MEASFLSNARKSLSNRNKMARPSAAFESHRARRFSVPRVVFTGVLIGALVSGCAPAPETPPDPSIAAQKQATLLLAKGDAIGAANVWNTLAQKSSPPDQQEFQLRAYRIFDNNGLHELAEQTLFAIDVNGALPLTAADVQLKRARIAKNNNDHAGVIRQLETLPFGLPDSLQRALLELRADAHESNGSPLLASADFAAIIALAPLAPEHSQLSERLSERLWTNLDALPANTLEQAAVSTAGTPIEGWLSLKATIKRAALTPELLQTRLADWQQRFPQHPAGGAFLNQLVAQLGDGPAMPKKIAVLLPLSGRFGAVGSVVRDGLLTAYYQLPAWQRPTIDFIDTQAARDEPIINSYLRAFENEAELVIGPLLKSQVTELARSEGLPIPVLALNRSNEALTPSGLLQFGLDPVDEARQIARHTQQQGLKHALVLVPEGGWGERVAEGLREELVAQGGEVLDVAAIGSKANALSEPVQGLLGLDQSEARKRAMERIIGQKLGFEPRRREDADFVFLAFKPQLARILKPLLKFHHAGDLPVFATSDVHSGEQDPTRDADMDGIEFVDIPWLIGSGEIAATRTRTENLWPRRSQQRPRLFALGYDALMLARSARYLRDAPGVQIEGASGKLASDELGIIHRELDFARFSRGVARPVETPSGLIIGSTAAN